MEVDVGEVERHRAALGDLLGFIQAGPRGLGVVQDAMMMQRGGEERFGAVVGSASFAEAVEGGGGGGDWVGD